MKVMQLNMLKKDYEPYLDLIKAIYNCDNDRDNSKSLIVVYDMLDNEKLIAVFSKSKYCADFFNTSEKCIDDNVHRGNLRKCRYKIERVYFKENYENRRL